MRKSSRRESIPVVILAAGMSSRIGDISKYIKKYYLPINEDEIIITRLLTQLNRVFKNIYVAVSEDDHFIDNLIVSDNIIRIKKQSSNNSYTVLESIDYLNSIGFSGECILVNADTIIGDRYLDSEKLDILLRELANIDSKNALVVGSRNDESWRVDIDESDRVIGISTEDYSLRRPYAILGLYKIDMDYYRDLLETCSDYFDDIYVRDFSSLDLRAVISPIEIFEVDSWRDYKILLPRFERVR